MVLIRALKHAADLLRVLRWWPDTAGLLRTGGRSRHAVALFFSTIILTYLVSVGEQAAADFCANGPGNYFIGYNHNTSSGWDFEGASGYIVVRDATLCAAAPTANSSSAWVMIASADGNRGQGYAQSGFARTTGGSGNGLRWFSEQYAQGVWAPETRYSYLEVGNQIGVRHAFRELWSARCSCVQMYIDSTLWSYTHFDPKVVWLRPSQPEFYGETWYVEDGVPGTPNAVTAFSALGAQVSDGTLMPMPCTLLFHQQSPYWSHAAHGCDAFDIWTE